MVGLYALATAITSPVMLLAQLNLRLVQAVDTERENSFADYFSLRLLTVFVAFCVLLLGLTVASKSRETAIVILLIGASKGVDALADIVHGLMQQSQLVERMGKSMAVRGVLQLAMMWVGLMISGDLIGGVSGVVVASIIVFVGYDSVNALRVLRIRSVRLALHETFESVSRTFTSLKQRQVLWQLGRKAFPLGLVAVFGSLYQSIPRLFIEHYQGLEALGFFSAVFYFTFAGFTVVAAFGNAASPVMAELFLRDLSAFNRFLVRSVLVCTAAGLAAIVAAVLVGDRLLALVYRPDYAAYSGVLVWVMVSSTVWYAATILLYAAVAVRAFRPQALLHALAALATLLSCWVLVPVFGMVGAAAALTIGVGVLMIGELTVMRRVIMSRSLHLESVQTPRLAKVVND